MTRELSTMRIKTPIGVLWLAAFGDSLWGSELEPRWIALALRLARKGLEIEPGTIRNKGHPFLIKAGRSVEQYFSGDPGALQKIPLALEGTETRLAVWRRVRKIRAGQTLTYAELAEAVGMAGSFRAIGAANAANPCALFVPDHRVIASDGGLQGYGAGVDAKAWLLAHESGARKRLTGT